MSNKPTNFTSEQVQLFDSLISVLNSGQGDPAYITFVIDAAGISRASRSFSEAEKYIRSKVVPA